MNNNLITIILVAIAFCFIYTMVFQENFDIVSKKTLEVSEKDKRPPSLAGMELNCDGQGLNNFRLALGGTPEARTFLYDFKCSKDVKLGDVSPFTTTAGPNQNFTDLSKHVIDCNKRALTSFELTNVDANNIKFSYKCGNKDLAKITDYNTEWSDASPEGASMAYLDRQPVSCPEGKVLSSVKLVKDPNANNIRYEFKCGEPSADVKPDDPWYKKWWVWLIIVCGALLPSLSASCCIMLRK